MNINESHDDDERYCLTSSRSSDKMADDNDTAVAAASTIIIVAAAVRRRRRRKRSRWMRDWYLCSSMVTYVRLNDQKIYRHFCRVDTAEYDELLALVAPITFDFVAGQYTLATECMEFDTFDCITKVEHVQLVQLCLTRQENGRLFVERTFDKTFDKDERASTLATKSIRRVRLCRRSTQSNVSNSTLSQVYMTGYKLQCHNPLLERIMALQLKSYLQSFDLLPSLKSSFRPGHSTETAVLRVMSDLLEAMDSGDVAALVLFIDLSAAFDTVDHGIFCRRLQVTFGLDGPVLAWFHSYLHGRSQCVRRGM